MAVCMSVLHHYLDCHHDHHTVHTAHHGISLVLTPWESLCNTPTRCHHLPVGSEQAHLDAATPCSVETDMSWSCDSNRIHIGPNTASVGSDIRTHRVSRWKYVSYLNHLMQLSAQEGFIELEQMLSTKLHYTHVIAWVSKLMNLSIWNFDPGHSF